jgi:hypothetical protein
MQNSVLCYNSGKQETKRGNMNNILSIKPNRISLESSMAKTIVRQMNQFEHNENKLLHYVYPDLEKRAWQAMDGKDVFKMNSIIKEFDKLL